MKIVKNVLAIIGGFSLLALIWIFVFVFTSGLRDAHVRNPEREQVAGVHLTDSDEVVYQDESYESLIGDGGGVFVVRLARPFAFDQNSWLPIGQLPEEFRVLLERSSRGQEHVHKSLQDPTSVWLLSHLKRWDENITDIVLHLYLPRDQIMIEWVSRS